MKVQSVLCLVLAVVLSGFGVAVAQDQPGRERAKDKAGAKPQAGTQPGARVGQKLVPPKPPADVPDDDRPGTPPAPAGAGPRTIPPPLESYKGRLIAQTMHFTGAPWLVRDSRESEERCSLMLATLGVKPGMKICDMGCGNGFYSIQMAKMAGEKGHVYGIDIQPEMLKMMNDRADREGVENITPILGTPVSPRLPKGQIDLILCVDVYHEFSYPEQMLAAMRESLAPGGRLVLVEFRAEDPNVPIKPEHKMSKAQILKELNPNGFKLVKEFDKLPWQHMMWFERE